VNHTTNTPDEPDDRASVATGEQATVVPDLQAVDGATPPDDASAPAASDGGARDEIPAGEMPATEARPASVHAATDADGATATLWLPSANGSAHHSVSDASVTAAPGTDGRRYPGTRGGESDTRTESTRAVPSSSPSVRSSASAHGPIPGRPGPTAATPPPWHRVFGQERPERAEPAASSHPPAAGGLLDDGPTTFLKAPIRSAPRTRSDAPPSERGGWSAVRAVRNRPPRQAALQLKRLDPWSVLKLALVLAVVLFFIWLVAVGMLYGVLDGMGVWDRLNGTYADLVSGEAPTGSPLISAGRVLGLAAVIGAINSVLFAVAATVGALVYNVSADLVGGIEVTLSERD